MAKSQAGSSEGAPSSPLPGVMGLFSATMLGVGAMIGAGIFYCLALLPVRPGLR